MFLTYTTYLDLQIVRNNPFYSSILVQPNFNTNFKPLKWRCRNICYVQNLLYNRNDEYIIHIV